MWSGGVNRNGFGRLVANKGGKVLQAHRVAWEIQNGPLPEQVRVVQTCKAKRCCNAEHMILIPVGGRLPAGPGACEICEEAEHLHASGVFVGEAAKRLGVPLPTLVGHFRLRRRHSNPTLLSWVQAEVTYQNTGIF